MIPVKDIDGKLWGYLGRNVDTATELSPKYLLPKNLPKSHFLFGSDVLKSGKFGQVPLKKLYLVESPFAVMKFASLGLPAVSPYGWSVSATQVELLTQLSRGVIYLPDRNKYSDAQNTATTLASRLWLRFPPLPDGVDDPEQLSLEQILALTR